ncbi:hypothetical protein F7018_07365 [Tenacibaculum aiptasiae]|uniref:Protease inhibitor I42 family protein n=1 Tax=Tenacibaculum aiptasiae TaxID=426481 RepID=A0A7J5AN51_9FLAO|nr:hypothetical protein [Tenacibaculum aiptasiae]KAB1158915.1 hypothetical protein F7018_07365 [Tenacibaculum aiptasiae]
MINIIRKSSLVLMLVTLLASCNDNDELVIDKNPLNAKIEFKKAKGLDIQVIGTSDDKTADYEWEVIDEVEKKAQRYKAENNEGKAVLGWGPRLGVTKFTLIITSKQQKEPIKVTKEFTRTQKEIDDHNGK